MNAGTNKNFKKLLAYAGIVTLALAAAAQEASAKSHENYFPLNVGNSWTYVDCNDGSTKTFTIIGVEKINGHTYCKFDDYWGELREGEEYLFRYEANRVLMWDSWWYNRHGEEVVRYDFTDGFWDGALLGTCRLKQASVDCNVPAGEFSDCINFQFLGTWCGPDAYYFGEYLAPNVGNIKYVVPGGEFPGLGYEGDIVTFELQSYTIYPVGDLNYDCRVDFYDFAIFASHWLECTAPECDVEVSVATDKSTYVLGEYVTVSVTAYNPNPEPVTLTFCSSCTASYLMDGVFDWFEVNICFQAETYVTIEPYDSYTRNLTHDLGEMAIYPLDVGTHTVVGEVIGYGYSEPVEFEVVPE